MLFRSAIAEPIKNMVKLMFPEAKDEFLFGASKLRSEIIDPKYKDSNGNPLTYRQALMDIGTLGRKYNSDVWVNCLDYKFKNFNGSIFIVSDLRFINEYNYLRNNNFYKIRIIRDEQEKLDDISEIEQEKIPDSDFDSVINNNGNMINLSQQVLKIAKKLGI